MVAEIKMFEVGEWDDDGHFFEEVLKEGLFRKDRSRKLSKSMGKRETEKKSQQTKLKIRPNRRQADHDLLPSNKKYVKHEENVADSPSGDDQTTKGAAHTDKLREIYCSANKLPSVKQKLPSRKRQREAETKKPCRDITVTHSEKGTKRPKQSESVESSDLYLKKAKLKGCGDSNDSYLSDARKRLDGAQFRWINEKLYTMDSSRAKEMFESNPGLYEVYHRGYGAQVEKWPVNPLDLIIADVKKQSKKAVVADFGCGNARLSQSVPNKVHSFDLVASNDHVTACDMSHVPLKSGSVDVSIFCLSLMGTNITDFLLEAHRVLKARGLLKIAEVASRFSKLDSFVRAVESLGFTLQQKDESNPFFVLTDFIKCQSHSAPRKKQIRGGLTLKPCLYKRR